MNRVVILSIRCCYLIFFAATGCTKDASGSAAFPRTKGATPVVSSPADKPIEPAKLKEDLDCLFITIEQTHPNMYAYVTPDEFARLKRHTYEAIKGSMTKQQFYWLVAPVVASLKSGHTCVSPLGVEFLDYLKAGGKCFPLKLYASPSGLVLQSYPSEGLPLGATVNKINDKDVNVVVNVLARCIASEHRDFNVTAVFQASAALWFWMAGYDTSKPLQLDVTTIEGKHRQLKLPAVTLTEVQAFQKQHKLEMRPSSYSFRILPGHNVGLLELNLLMEDERDPFEKFLKRVFREMHEKNAPDLIIDLRKNPGGNTALGDELMAYLTDRPLRQASVERLKMSPLFRKMLLENKVSLEDFEKEDLGGQKAEDGKVYDCPAAETKPKPVAWPYRGRIYLLIGRKNYSSAAMLASAMKHYRLAVLVGEETGEPTAQYGNILSFRLPNTDLQVGVACKYFVMAGGCEDKRGVIPDHEVIETPDDLAKGKDPAMDYVLDYIRHAEPSPCEVPAYDAD
ncbi:MAG: S41 family peptidase [Phycisphaerae bacterium]|jgi:hypothetical protein